MIIREAADHELNFIREQRVNAYREHAQMIPNGHWKALELAISSEADTGTGVELLVAEINGNIVGSVVLFPPNTDAYEGMWKSWIILRYGCSQFLRNLGERVWHQPLFQNACIVQKIMAFAGSVYIPVSL
jgi:hypothetical protein